MNEPTPEEAVERLSAMHEDSLKKHSATHQASYHNFIAYIGQEPDGRWFYWVYSWGVDHGKIYGATEEEARAAAERAYA